LVRLCRLAPWRSPFSARIRPPPFSRGSSPKNWARGRSSTAGVVATPALGAALPGAVLVSLRQGMWRGEPWRTALLWSGLLLVFFSFHEEAEVYLCRVSVRR